MILTEKYRPKSFDDKFLIKTRPILELEDRVNTKKEFPHLLFSGEPGTGKTTIAHILIREIIGDQNIRMKDVCLDLNASDSRKIDDVRGKIKEFAQVRSLYSKRQFIFLDEVDSMTKDAQNALRRIMEDTSENCMFILSCNYPHKLIQPIKSRCTNYKFPKPTLEEIFPTIKYIVQQEKINITDEAIKEVIRQTNYDIRETINWLDGHSGNLQISVEDIKILNESYRLLDIVDSNLPINTVCDQLQEIVTNSEPHEIIRDMLTEVNKRYMDKSYYTAIIEKLAETHYRILSMSNTDGQIQLLSFLIWLYDGIKITEKANVEITKDYTNLGKVESISIEVEAPKGTFDNMVTSGPDKIEEKDEWDDL